MKRQTHSGPVSKLHPVWVKQVKHEFVTFLRATKFPEPIRNGTRGSTFAYPRWLFMLIAVLAVKAKLNSYMRRHRLTVEYWSLSTPDKRVHSDYTIGCHGVKRTRK